MTHPVAVEVAVLGPVRMFIGDREVDLGTPRQRTIVAALALSRGRPVALEALIQRVWGDAPPPTAVNTLQRYVASLRRSIEPERPAREAPSVITTEGGGYALRIPLGARDVTRLEDAVAQARQALTVVPDPLRPRVPRARADQVEQAIAVLDDALALWRGDPYADLGEDPDASAERTRLHDVLTSARELRLVALMALGRHAEVVGELESMTALHPLHERWWALYAVALVRSGRQAEALEAMSTLRALLADELGVDPSTPLRDLHTAILRQDSTIEWSDDVAPAAPPRLSPAPAPAAPSVAPPTPRWPLTGRRDEVAALRDLVDRAGTGTSGVAYVTGEAGIGKTRLVQEVALLAHAAGFTVATAGCSQEAPPDLWPVRVALTALARQRPGVEIDTTLVDNHPEEFRTREHVVDSLVTLGASGPVLMVVEDVQWADPTTLLVLEQLVARRLEAPVVLVLTRRTGTGDDERMARLAESVARAEGVRVDLATLSLEETSALVHAVDEAVSDVGSVWRRSGGNAFFAIELARSGGELSGGLADVVRSRVMTLPTGTVAALRAASAIDVAFDVRLLALMLEQPEDDVRDLLAPAVAAGVLLDDESSFAHAVVREVVYSDLSSADRALWHAAAGAALAEHGDLRRVEQRAGLVRHWELAGTRWSGTGWRSVLAAAAQARSDAAYVEEARYLRRAVALQEMDPDSGDREGFELLLLLVDACRWSGDWSGVSDAVDEAMVLAERLEDDALGARAAISAAEGALWQVRAFGYVHPPIVEALERLLFRLGDNEAPLRCRAQLALAMELYYDPSQTERIDRLVADALAYAEQSDDLRLRFTAYHGAFVSTWRLDTVEQRRDIAERALDVARRLDDPRALVFAETLAVAAASELGDTVRVRGSLDRTIDLARRRGLAAAEGVLRVLALSWSALGADTDGTAAQLDALRRLVETAPVPNFEAAVGATDTTVAMLSGDPQLLQEAIARLSAGEIPTELFTAAVLLRLGLPEMASTTMEGVEPDLLTHTFLGPLGAALACQVGAALGATATTREAYAYLDQHRGRMCSAGAATVLGPVDLFLAVGALALGDPEAAREHLDEATRLVEERGLTGLAHELGVVREAVEGVEAAGRRFSRGA